MIIIMIIIIYYYIIYIYIYWLVVYRIPLQKYEFVNGKDDIPYMKRKIKTMFDTTNFFDPGSPPQKNVLD